MLCNVDLDDFIMFDKFINSYNCLFEGIFKVKMLVVKVFKVIY